MMDYDSKIIGSRIKKFRNRKKLSQKALADLTGISKSYIATLETGGGSEGSSVSLANICKIATVLDVTLDDIAYTNIEKKYIPIKSEMIKDCLKEIDMLGHDELELFDKVITTYGNVRIIK